MKKYAVRKGNGVSPLLFVKGMNQKLLYNIILTGIICTVMLQMENLDLVQFVCF